MKSPRVPTLAAAVLAAGLLGPPGLPALAGDGIEVSGAFARATIGRARNGAAYLVLRNTGTEDDRLVGARSAAAARVSLHTHLHEGGVARMRPVEAIGVPAGGTAALRPGGDHLMAMGLKAPLEEGGTLALVLVFERAGEIALEIPIGPPGARAAPGAN